MSHAHKLLSWTIALLISAAVLGILFVSLDNPVRADLAMLHYSGFLMQEKGFLLYRDILEINFPTPFLLHQWLGAILGYEALPLRWLDVLSMGLMAALSWHILKPLSPASAVIAPGLFALFYMVNGAEYTLERDYLVILPTAAAFLYATSSRLSINTTACIIGFLCGIACSFKPNAIVAAPALFAVFWLQSPTLHTPSHFIKAAMCAAAMFVFTLGVPFAIIQQQGVLDDFIQLYKTFLPIYARTRQDLFHYANPTEYWNTLGHNYVKYAGLSAVLSLPGLCWASINAPVNSKTMAHCRLLQLGIMAFAFTLYEVIAGKFWVSHMMPSAYWSLLCFSLLATTPLPTRYKQSAAIVLLLVMGTLGAGLTYFSATTMLNYANAQHQGPNRATKVAHYLKANLQTGDTVQTLDFAGDAQACLLESRATSATRFLIDVPLYLEPDSAATQALRKEFMQSLTEKPPAFIVYFENMLHPGGGNRLREFRALFAFIEKNYTADTISEGEYTIYRLK